MTDTTSHQLPMLVETFLRLADRIGVPVILLGWFIAVDAGWFPSKTRDIHSELKGQQYQLSSQSENIANLALAVKEIADIQKHQYAAIRDMWCYGMVKDQSTLLQCLKPQKVFREEEARGEMNKYTSPR